MSSVYREQASQAMRLIDGDLATAWNSRTGDLVGAWIEARVPAEATVVAIALTPGFTVVRGDSDLFLGNHRVARVRVLRDGVELGTYALDVESRTPVRVPAGGPGGVYRIEVVEVVPGTRPTWRETCISELQIVGVAPGMTPGARIPRTAVAALPAPRPDPSTLDRAALDAAQRRDLTWLASAWSRLQADLRSLAENTGEPDPDEFMRQDFARQRNAMLARIATLAEVAAPAASDALRGRIARGLDWSDFRARRTEVVVDLDAMSDALEAVADVIGSDEARCRTAQAVAGMRLVPIANGARLASYFDEIDESERMVAEEPITRAQVTRSRALERDDARLGAIRQEFRRRPADAAARLLAMDTPADPAVAAEWPALRAQLERARTACRWSTAP